MAINETLLRRVRASKAEDYSESSASSEDENEAVEATQSEILEEDSSDSDPSNDKANIQSSNENSDSDADSGTDADGPETTKEILSSISFGDLAAAASSLPRKRKRSGGASQSPDPGHTSSRSQSRSPSPFHEASERQAGKSARPVLSARASKHAPQEISSKKAVSRRRTVVAVPRIEARDPRFSNLSAGGVDANRVRTNYAFLNDYRNDEMKALKEQVKEVRDAKVKERLRKQLRAMEDRERARRMVEEERDVVREHRKKESEAVKGGKRPYFLKKGEIKKQVLVKKFEGLGERKAEKVMERRRKKKASKEKKSMPRFRREVE